MYRSTRNSGFTMIELMITVVVLAIIAAIAVPSFQTLVENNRITTQSNALLGALQLARSEAIKRGVNVSVAAEAGGFVNGWCVTTAANCGAAGEIRRFGALQGTAVNASANIVQYSNRGERLNQANPPITIALRPTDCAAGDGDRVRTVTITLSGRAAITRGNC